MDAANMDDTHILSEDDWEVLSPPLARKVSADRSACSELLPAAPITRWFSLHSMLTSGTFEHIGKQT